VASWNDPPEDDEPSGPALQWLVESLVESALLALRRAFSGGDSVIRLRAELLLEVARAMRRDARAGSWSRLPTRDRTHLRRAVLFLESLAQSGQPVPVA